LPFFETGEADARRHKALIAFSLLSKGLTLEKALLITRSTWAEIVPYQAEYEELTQQPLPNFQ
jgi:hypothetical protein